MRRNRRFSRLSAIISLLLALTLLFTGCEKLKLPDGGLGDIGDIGDLPEDGNGGGAEDGDDLPGGGDTDGGDGNEGGGDKLPDAELPDGPITLDSIPAWDGESAYIPINGNMPYFTEGEYVTSSFERYDARDALGRCGVTYACVGQDIMPTEERGSISSVTPSGWNNQQYDSSLVPGGWLYNRCHLIGWQLTGEDANKENLITGTQFLNIEGMLPFENMIADYVKDTGNHVLYRVTPIFEGYNLVASGVLLEAWSVEDMGEGICFCIYSYNVQPGIYINYYDGTNRLATPDDVLGGGTDTELPDGGVTEGDYVLNVSSKKIHKADCRYATSIKEENRGEYHGNIQDLIDDGYEVCKTCKPE